MNISPNAENRKIITEIFDPVARPVIDAIGEALPNRGMEEAQWSCYIIAPAGRIYRLSGGRRGPDGENATATHMVALLVVGLERGKLPEQRFQRQSDTREN